MSGEFHSGRHRRISAAPDVPLQHWERVLIRRKKVIWFSVGFIASALVLAVFAILAIAETDWGHEFIRKTILKQVAGALAGHGKLYIGHLDGGLGGDISIDSLAITDQQGVIVAAASHVEANVGLAGLFRGNVRVTRLLLVRPYFLIEQMADGSWNLDKLFPPKPKIHAPTARSALTVAIDSAEVRDGHVVLLQPDSLPTIPKSRRDFAGLQLKLGPTEIMHPGKTGGHAQVLAFVVKSSNPPLDIKQSNGNVTWWSDSLLLDFASFRLPASHATLKGSVAWNKPGPPRLDLHILADTLSLADVAWTSALIPKSGGSGIASLIIRSGTDPHDLQYVLSKIDVQMAKSRLTGGFTAIVGKKVSVVNLALGLQPLDLDLVREIFGDSLPPKVWQGSLAGTIYGAGGPLTALKLDSVNVAYTDRRAANAVSHVSLNGVLDVKAQPVQLNHVEVLLHDLDVHTLGAVTATADSMFGVLRGRVVLNGPANNLPFNELALVHIDGDKARSYVSGEGRIATDHNGNWLEAKLTLDTIAVATLASSKGTVPLRGVVTGTLGVEAVRDTMNLDALLHAGPGTVHFIGSTLLDSTRTVVNGTATLDKVDPRVLIDRKDIPAMRLDGSARLAVESSPNHPDAHVQLSLDTTSILGTSHIQIGQAIAGFDDRGFHVDTAELHATAWRLNAAGRLAKTGVTSDTLAFDVHFDSLAPLRALLLDSAGKAVADSVHGGFSAKGTLVGSLDTLVANVDFSADHARWTEIYIDTISGHATLNNLPKSPSGLVTASAKGFTASGFRADSAALRATVSDGEHYLLSVYGTSGDTMSAAVHADAKLNGDTARVSVDTLNLKLGKGLWTLDHPTRIVKTPSSITIDSTTLRSSLGARNAYVSGSAVIPETGAVKASLSMRAISADELAFAGILSPNLTAQFASHIEITGTRDAPLMDFSAALDSVKVDKQLEPSLSLSGKYADKKVQFALTGSDGKRAVLNASGTAPIDLTLRAVDKRITDAPVSIHIVADSAPLAGLEAVVPGLSALSGQLSTDVMVSGPFKKLAGTGKLQIRNGAFDYGNKLGLTARGVLLDATLAPDSITITHFRMNDSDSPRDTASLTGYMYRTKLGWVVAGESYAYDFGVIDNPSLAIVSATWHLKVSGALKEPHISGDVVLPSAIFIIDSHKRVRTIVNDSDVDSDLKVGEPLLSGLTVTLGNDVRLKSSEANVQLSGSLEMGGQLHNPYISGIVSADRGTYRVDLGVIQRTFRVDSGTVQLAGTIKEVPPALNIWASYVVRRSDRDDINIGVHLTGTADRKILDLSTNDLGTAAAQSEIISYLVFGTPSFALDGQSSSTVNAATAALVPTVGGILEGALTTVLPFVNSLQITPTVQSEIPQTLTTSPLDGLLNSSLTAGRQIGSDTFLSLSGGRCSGTRTTTAGSITGWFGISAEYRPKYSIGAIISLDPGSSPCTRIGKFNDIYQFGLDIFKDWKY